MPKIRNQIIQMILNVKYVMKKRLLWLVVKHASNSCVTNVNEVIGNKRWHPITSSYSLMITSKPDPNSSKNRISHCSEHSQQIVDSCGGSSFSFAKGSSGFLLGCLRFFDADKYLKGSLQSSLPAFFIPFPTCLSSCNLRNWRREGESSLSTSRTFLNLEGKNWVHQPFFFFSLFFFIQFGDWSIRKGFFSL